MLAAHRHAVQAGVADRHRLDQNAAGAALRAASSTAPSNAERNGRTRLPSLDVPSANNTTETPLASRLTISLTALAGLMAARAIDKHRALQLGGNSNQRPARDFALGDKSDRRDRADHQDVGPRYMIGTNSTARSRTGSPLIRTRIRNSEHSTR